MGKIFRWVIVDTRCVLRLLTCPRGYGVWLFRKGFVVSATKKAVLVDIDGTLVSLTDFDYSVFDTGDKSQIDSYLEFWNAETMKSTALQGGIEKLKEFKEMGYVLVFLTARGVSCKKYTLRKLREIGVLDMVDSMWHRPVKWDGVSSSVYKDRMITMLKKKGYEFEWAMDDEEKNLIMMEKHGMKVLDARKWW